MVYKSHLWQRYRRGIRFINYLTRHIYTCKIPIILLTCQPPISSPILEYNTIKHLDFLSDNNEENIRLMVSNNSEKIKRQLWEI